MKTTTEFFRLTFLIIVLLSLSCSPEDGRDGEQGLQGIAGQDGTDGVDGNANVIVSPWIDQDFATSSSIQSSFGHIDSQITLDAVNTAAFLVYGKRTNFSNTSNTVIVTPIPVAVLGRFYSYDLFPETNGIVFKGSSVDGTTFFNFNDFAEFRYVIIPPNTSKGEKSDPNFNKMTYKEVMDYLELDY